MSENGDFINNRTELEDRTLRVVVSLGLGKTGETQMIKFSAMYPNRQGVKFDMAYYINHHIPMVRQLLGSTLKGVSVEQGISGLESGSSAPYVAMGHLLFDSLEAFQISFGQHSQAITGDIPNYTNCEPTVQIGEVKL